RHRVRPTLPDTQRQIAAVLLPKELRILRIGDIEGIVDVAATPHPEVKVDAVVVINYAVAVLDDLNADRAIDTVMLVGNGFVAVQPLHVPEELLWNESPTFAAVCRVDRVQVPVVCR